MPEENVPEKEEGLSVDDLMNVLRVINTSTERGAFKANELSFVGSVYDKFARFIKEANAAEAVTETTEISEGDADGSE
jgi:hypothetical protein